MSNLELTYSSLVNRVSNVIKKDTVFRFVQNLLVIFSCFTALSIFMVIFEALFRFNSLTRTIIFFSFVSSLSASLVFIFTYYIISFQSTNSRKKLDKYALLIGKCMPEVKDELINTLQVYEFTKKHNTLSSSLLAGGSLLQLEQKTRERNFSEVINAKNIKRLLYVFVSLVVIFTILQLTFPNTFGSSLNRLLNYNYIYIDNTLGIAFEIQPGNTEIAKGESVEINSRIMFNDPNFETEEIKFYTREISPEGTEVNISNQLLKSISKNQFNIVLKSININTLYWFEYKGIRSKEYKITVTSRPVIKSMKIKVYPPAYTKLPSRMVEGNEITVITGSKIYIELESNINPDDAFLELSNNLKVKLEFSGNTHTTSLVANRNTDFKIVLSKKSAGKELFNTNPPKYKLRVYPDEYPHITIIEPEAELMVQNTKEILVRSRVTDDFGFTKMRLAYRLSKSKYGIADNNFRFTEIPVQNKDATGLEVPYLWNLSALNPGTDDEVEYYVEVYDNDAVSGPKMTRTDTRKIIFPSLEALLNKTEKSKEEIETSLKTAEQDALELKRQLDEIKEHLTRNPEEMGLNDPKKQQELQNKIDNIQTNLQNTRQKLEELINDLMNSSQISPETLEIFMEVQQLLQKIDSQELRDALKKLQEALKNMNKEQIREAMKNFKFDEEAFKKALEKTKELLEKILAEQKFGELTQKLDEITIKQNEVKEQTKNTDEKEKSKLSEISKIQDELKKQYEEFQKQLRELKDKFKELKNDQFSKELEKMLKEMQKKNVEQKMKQSSVNLQQGNKNNSQKQQEQLSQDLNELNQKMQDLLEMMMDIENQKLMQKMQEFMNQLQELSEKQGELKEQTEELDKNSKDSDFKEKSNQQQQLQNELSNTIENMMSLQQQIGIPPQMSKNLGDAYNEMGNAKQNLDKKNKNSATSSQQKAKDALDKVLKQLQQMCQSGNKPGNKPGSSLQQLLQMLQQMIARQQVLNQQLNAMLQQGNQGKLSQQQMAEMQRMVQEQETIRKNLQQLNEEFKKQQEMDGKKLLGNLDQVQKDMQEVIKDIQENNITPETKKRQEKILQRMLDFQLSAREKDFEQKRQSRPGKNIDRESPPEIVISRPTIINGINQDALELQRESYNEDYEVLIQKYKTKLKQLLKK